jgi:hypothetical protein
MSEPEKPDDLLESVANLDTARMTLRWALDRMRSLETGNAEMRELLKAAAAGREGAVQELERFRLAAEDRLKRLDEKERFVKEMQGILNSLFKGELDVTGFVAKKQELEKTQELLEAKVRKRLAEAEEAHKREVSEHARLLAEMEGTYSGALAEAQRRFHEQASAIDRRRQEELTAEHGKTSQARDEALKEVQLQGEQYHQKTLLLETEYSAKRKELEVELGRLQEKLVEEHRQAALRQTHLHEILRDRLSSEKSQLEAELALRDSRVSELRQTLAEVESSVMRREAEAARKAFERFETERKDYRERIEALRREAAARQAEIAHELEALRAEIAERESRHSAEREALLAEQTELRRKDAERHREQLDADRRALAEWQRRRDSEHLAAQEVVERQHAAREAELREAHARDLESARAGHAEQLRRLEGEIARLRDRHEGELKLRDEEAARLFSKIRSDDAERDHRTASEFDAQRVQHAAEFERLTSELARQQERFQVERSALIAQFETARGVYAQELAAARAELAKRFDAETERLRLSHAGELGTAQAEAAKAQEALRSLHAEQTARLKEELERLKVQYESETAEKQQDAQRLRENLRIQYAEQFQRLKSEIERFKERHEGELAARGQKDQRLQDSLNAAHAEQLTRMADETARLRSGYEAEIERLKVQSAASIETLQKDLQNQAGTQRQAEEDRSRRTAVEADSLHAKYREQLDNLAAQMQQQGQAFHAERSALFAEFEKVRKEDAAKHAEALRALEASRQAEAVRHIETLRAMEASRQNDAAKHAQTLQALDASHKAQQSELLKQNEARFEALRQEAARWIQAATADMGALRERTDKARADLDAQRLVIVEQEAGVRRDDAQRYEAALHALEKFFLERNNERLRDTVEQLEQMRRTYSKMLASQKEEALAESERNRKESSELRLELAKRPKPPADVLEGGEAPKPPLQGRFKMLAWSASALGLAAAAAFSWVFWFSGRDYTVPFSHPTGLLWEGDTLWASDWYDGAIHQLRLGPDGLSSVKRYPIPAHVMGMTRINGTFYVVDSWARLIERWVIDGKGLRMERSWPSPGDKPSAIHYDGKDLWTADAASRRIYRHSVDDDLTVLESFPAEEHPVGMASDEKGGFWSAGGADRLFLHRQTPGLSVLEAYRFPDLSDGSTPLSCFAWRGRKLWVGLDGSFKLAERPRWRLKKAPLTPSK